MKNNYQAIAIGASAGGLSAVTTLLEKLPTDYPIPVVVVQHRANDQRNLLEEVLQSKCRIRIKQADEKEEIKRGIVYIAPSGYHLLVEQNRTLSLSSHENVSFSRPSIDVLFESAAEVFKEQLVGVILTGSNNDGAAGLMIINKYGGLTIAQLPQDAQYPFMPQAAIELGGVKHVWTLEEISNFLYGLALRS